MSLHLSKASQEMGDSFVRQVLKVVRSRPGVISLAGGLPHPDSFPVADLQAVMDRVMQEEGTQALQYGVSDGDPLLKAAILREEGLDPQEQDRLMITVGSTNGIYYVTRSLVDAGDVVLTEVPGYPGSLSAMKSCGAHLVGVPMDEEGMDPQRLREALGQCRSEGRRVALVYLIPDFQNPSGRTMSLQRRREILQIAREADLLILEDQPYRDLRFSGEDLPTLSRMAREGGDADRVLMVRSFSKVLGPGLRVAYACGHPSLITAMVRWQQKVTVCPDTLAQRVVARWLEGGGMAGQRARLLNLYAPRCQTMLQALEEMMPEGVSWTRPQGGMFVWLSLQREVDTAALWEKGLDAGVAYVPGVHFFLDPEDGRRDLRLNFSFPDPGEIRRGVALLAELLRS